MKVLMIHLAGGGGGIELFVSQIAKSVSKQNNEVILLVGSYVFKEDYYRNSGVRIIQFDSQKSYLKMSFKLINPNTYHQILKIIEREKPDVIHLLLEDLISGVLFCLLKLKGKKLVLTEHDPKLHSGENLLVLIHLSITKFLLRKTVDRIIVHGNNLKNILIQKGISEASIEVIPLGEFSYYKRWGNEKQNPKNTVLFFGRIQEYKGLDNLIQAVPLIVKHIPDLKVIIAGEGAFDSYKKIISNEKYFEIHNRYILDEEVSDLFQRANVVVLPYKDGTQTGIIPIAYSFKKPVIVTNVGSFGEVVEDGVTGFIVPPKDISLLSEAIVNILQNDEMRMKMGENAYLRTQTDLSWEQVARRTISLYKNME